MPIRSIMFHAPLFTLGSLLLIHALLYLEGKHPMQRERPDFEPKPAFRVLAPRDRDDFLSALNYIIDDHQNDPLVVWPDVLRNLRFVDHQLRVHYYRDGLYFVADPIVATEEEHRTRVSGIGTVVQQQAPGYKGHFIVCASHDGQPRVFDGGGNVPWLTTDEKLTLAIDAKFYGLAPSLIAINREYNAPYFGHIHKPRSANAAVTLTQD